MPRLIIALAAMLAAASSWAQSARMEEFRNRYRENFENYRTEKKAEFEAYRARLNAEFAEMLSAGWKDFPGHAPQQLPAEPKPPAMPAGAASTKADIEASAVKHAGNATNPPDGFVAPADRTPAGAVELPPFYHTRCSVTPIDASTLSGASTAAAAVTKVWQRLSADDKAAALAADCLRLRSRLSLCDWAYVLLVQHVARNMAGANQAGEAILASWLLCQSGYDARPGIADNRLCTLFCSDTVIYSTPYAIIDGKQYYPLGYGSGSVKYLSTVAGKFAGDAAPVCMTMTIVPQFTPGHNPAPYTSAAWKEAPPFGVQPNTSLVEFMQDYALVAPEIHAASAVSDEVRSSLFQAIGMIVDGMSVADAANTVLRYVQHGFDYMTDGDQFGREKPFFVEENFIHAFNDCEDRAILFARLAHDVLGLDAVLVRYPGHMCAAVAVPGVSDGAAVSLGGKRYSICDPTLKPTAPARVGYLHPSYLKEKPEVTVVAWH